jgi:hypothetical protein
MMPFQKKTTIESGSKHRAKFFLQAPKPIDPKRQNFWSREFPKAKNQCPFKVPINRCNAAFFEK